MTQGKKGRKARKWTDSELALLGTMPDRSVAKAIGVHAHTVIRMRRSMEIPAFYTPHQWSAVQIALLGTMTDVALSRWMGVSKYVVGGERRRRGIASASIWSPQTRILIGTMPDAAVAAMSGIAIHNVTSERNRLGLQPYYPSKKWTKEQAAMLGTMSDAEVGRRTGRARSAVITKRRELGIAAFVGAATPANPYWKEIEAEYKAGKVIVRHTAEKYGVSVKHIHRKARENGWARDWRRN